MKTGEIVIEYLKKYPNLLTKTLARLIVKENPDTFANVEAARRVIRYYRGASGKDSKCLSDKSFIRENGDQFRGWALQPDTMDYTPYVIPTAYKRLLILSDIHIPYHDADALRAAIEFGKQKDIDAILLNGDIIDCLQLSKFPKDAGVRNTQYEIDALYEFMCALQDTFPKAKLYFKEGNHEFRLKAFLRIKAVELTGMEEFELPVLANFADFGAEWIDRKRVVVFDKLNILHGHEFPGMSSSVNPARALFLKSKKNAVCGHFHQTSEHSEPDLTGKPIACWSVGCLCQLHPEYMPLNRWNHGFAYVERRESGFSLDNIRIYNGRIL